MGWQDRDYARDQPQRQRVDVRRSQRGGGGGGYGGGPGGPGGPGGGGIFGGGRPSIGKKSVVFWLLVINIGVFVVDGLLGRILQTHAPLGNWGYFSAEVAIMDGQVWRFLTFQFLHASPGHLFGNMLGIFFLGPLIESYLGSRRFLAFYLLSGFAGVFAYLFFWQTGFVFSESTAILVGASGGVFGILIAAACVAPNVTVLVMFIIPMKLRTVAWCLVAFAAYTVLAMGDQSGSNAGGEAAHLGGAAVGYLLIRKTQWLNFADGFGSMWRNFKGRAKKRRDKGDDAEMDRILDKIRDQGLHSLSESEKQILQRASDNRKSA
jgi:membrane associated rhomboid family serine protease